MSNLGQQDYEYITWRFAKTLNKFGYKMPSLLKVRYKAFAYKYGCIKHG